MEIFMTRNPVFQAANKQGAGSGEPPYIDANTPNRYHGYFENDLGEQLIFVFDFEMGTGTLYHGDMGWEKPQKVQEGRAPEIVLDQAETLWLMACWTAATSAMKLRKP
jgi:hypothetical protein